MEHFVCRVEASVVWQDDVTSVTCACCNFDSIVARYERHNRRRHHPLEPVIGCIAQ